jgi:hypothetical protein
MKLDEHHAAQFSAKASIPVLELRPAILQQMAVLARQLAKVATSLNGSRSQDGPPPGVFAEQFSQGLQQIIKGRRIRDRFFPANLFADPAWDILLDLTVARLEGRQISVSSAAIAAAVPTATALRWLKQLVDIGLIERVLDPTDKRRTFILVSDDTFERMTLFANAFSKERR